MPVSNYNKYELTDHAKQRISERLGITVKDMYRWTYRMLSEAVPIESTDTKEGVRYQARNIVFVLDEAEHKVLTVYPESKYGADTDLREALNPDLVRSLQKPLRDYLKKRQAVLSNEVAGYVNDLNFASLNYQNTAAPEDLAEIVNIMKALEGQIGDYYQTLADVQKLQITG